MKTVLLLASLAMPAHAQQQPPPSPSSQQQEMPAPKAVPAKVKKALAPFNKKVDKLQKKVEKMVPQPLKQSVAVATTTVSAPFLYLKDTLFLVRTEFDGMLLLHLPSLDSDPNRGVTWGVMPVLLVSGKGEAGAPARIQTIVAPSLTQNPIFGVTGTFRLLRYHDPWQQISVTGSLSEHTNYAFVGSYSNSELWGHHYLDLRAGNERDGSHRFFGIGPLSRHGDQADYTLRTLGYRVTFGQPVATRCKVGIQQRLEKLEMTGTGPLKGVPSLDQKFPALAGPQDLQLAWYRLYTSYDSRDSAATPTRGQYVNLYWETSPRSLLSDRNMSAWGGDLRAYFPHGPKGQGLVFTPRLKWQSVEGNDIPFYALSRLGGKDSLRGFGDGRFVDKGMYAAGAEERWTGFKTEVMETPIEFETGPFFEAGQVFPRFHEITARETRTVAGFFLRGVARPQIVGSFDMGWGSEGPAVFLDVDYSW